MKKSVIRHFPQPLPILINHFKRGLAMRTDHAITGGPHSVAAVAVAQLSPIDNRNRTSVLACVRHSERSQAKPRNLIPFCLLQSVAKTRLWWAALCLFLLSATANAAPYSGGSGTEADPYQISTIAHWQELMNTPDDWGKYFCLNADIDMAGANLSPVGNLGVKFNGFFDGQGHILRNVTINQPSNNYVGLFGYQSGGQIRNLGLVDANIQGNDFVGGLVGRKDAGNITSCYATGTVRGGLYVGSLVGGGNIGGTITSSYSIGTVVSAQYSGGVIGYNDGSVTSCYSMSTTSGSYAGGLVGYNRYGVIIRCYSTGSGRDGGLVAWNDGTVVYSFWDTETSGHTTSAGGTGKTTAEMKTKSTFTDVGWDFDTTWSIIEGVSYPTFIVPIHLLINASSGPNGNIGPNGIIQVQPGGNITFTATPDSGFTVDTWYLDDNPAQTGGTNYALSNVEVNHSVQVTFKPKPLKYSGGSGTEADPYQISTVADWQKFMNTSTDWDKSFILTNDLDMAGIALSPVAGIAFFTGVFDGQGHTIRNAVINQPNNDYAGLFGYIATGGQIKNLGVVNANISGFEFVGALVGFNWGTVTSCYTTGAVTGSNYVGGLVGRNNGTINSCYSTGTVTVNGGTSTGGLVGINYGNITACYATGMVSGHWHVGGLVGWNFNNIAFCYSTGAVSGNSEVGGLVGYRSGGTTTSCFWNIETSGWATSVGGTGKTTVEMKNINTYLNDGWDLSVTDGDPADWIMPPYLYPQLSWQTLYSGGNGTESDPYPIATVEDWQWFMASPADWNKSFILTADLDLAGVTLTPVGNDDVHFTGVFDGNGQVIRNAIINLPNNDYVGLFAFLDSGGKINNLGLVNVDIKGHDWVGGLVGSIGWDYYVGGLVGNSGTIDGCYATGSISGFAAVGGLVGWNFLGSITACYFAGTVSSTYDVGGLCGDNYGTITSCYAQGAVSGNHGVGGLAGMNGGGTLGGTITSCYSTGTVSGSSSFGGFVGQNSDTITSCFWDTQTSGLAHSDGGTGKTTAEMKIKNTYLIAGWDIGSVWVICDGIDYPHLLWEEGILCPKHYSGGSGSQDDPYQIATPADLIALGNTPADYDKYFIVTADIDLAGRTFDRALIAPDIDDATNDFQGSVFSGRLNGNGHTIRNLSIRTDPVKRDFLALIGWLDPGASVENLALTNVSVVGVNNSWYLAGLCGLSQGTISTCSATGAIQGGDASNELGGLCGTNWGSMSGCTSAVAVSAGNNSRVFGGLCGQNGGTITACSAAGPVTGNDGSWYFGGLCGRNEFGIINASATGDVLGGNNTQSLGGLCGDNQATIEVCSAAGPVHGGDGSIGLGGLCGNNNGSISDCYATGNLTGGTGSNSLGGLCGMNSQGTLFLSYATGSIDAGLNSSLLGGLCGDNEGTIIRCHAAGSVHGGAGSVSIGGLCGVSISSGTIGECYTAGRVTGDSYVGGLVGRNESSAITACYATGSADGKVCVGGLTGWNSGPINTCYATAEIHGQETIGGLTGYNLGTLADCYATGTVVGAVRYIGGLVGWNDWGTITHCYSDGFVSGKEAVGGLVGFNYSGAISGFWNIQTSGQTASDGGVGKTTAEMKTQSTFTGAGWNFVTVWKICDGLDYPHLQWELYDCSQIPRYAGGSGTAEDPYHIRTAEQLQTLALHPDDWDKYFRLVADIDLSGLPNLQIGRYGEEGDLNRKPFTGWFDCRSSWGPYMISNYRFHTDDIVPSVGLFGYLGQGAYIDELILEAVDIDAPNASFVGGMVGVNEGGVLEDCQVHGRIVGMEVVGGLVGFNSGGFLSDCRVKGEVRGRRYIGGLVGYNYDSGRIEDCHFQGTAAGDAIVGGIAGSCDEVGFIRRCFSTGIVKGDDTLGGIAGSNYFGSAVEDCGSLCDIIGTTFAGGLVGVCDLDASVARSYAAGAVIGSQASGGLIGFGNGNATNSFWDIQTSTRPTSAGGQGKSTAVMKSNAFFLAAGWDFEDEDANGDREIWMIRDGISYPRLTTMYTSGADFAGDYGVGLEEFAVVADRWLADCSIDNNWCDGVDFNHDRLVDLADLLILSSHWMEGQ
jgi:hypothetical protein